MLITLRVRLSNLVVYVLEISMNASVTPSKIYKKLYFKTKTKFVFCFFSNFLQYKFGEIILIIEIITRNSSSLAKGF